MGRHARDHKANVLLHITAHAIPDRVCCPDAFSRAQFLQLALAARRLEPCLIHAYALMDNHIHLLMAGEIDGSIGRMLKWLLSQHTKTLNRSAGRVGPCWHGRYSFVPIKDEAHLLRSHLYIEANPWRAGLVDHPAESTWTSYGFNGLGQRNELLTPHEVLLGLAGPGKDWHNAYCDRMDEYIQTAVRYKSPMRKPLYSDPLAGLQVFGVDIR